MRLIRFRTFLNQLKQRWSLRYIANDYQCARLASAYRFAGGFHRIYHYHIRKTGGTSLNHLFLSLGGRPGAEVYAEVCQAPYRPIIVNDKVFAGWNEALIKRGNYYYALSHMPAHRLNLPAHTFTITCLRDPVARIISLYSMILAYRDEPNPDRRKVRQLLWLGNSFSNFLANLPQEELLGQIYMFSKTFNRNEAFEKISGCSHYMFTEEFSIGIQELSAKLNIRLEAPHIRKSTIKHEISPLILEELRTRLEPEYMLYQKLRAQTQLHRQTPPGFPLESSS